MENQNALESRIQKVLESLEIERYSHSTISVYRIAYNRLLIRAAEMQTDSLSEKLKNDFIQDFVSPRTRAFCHSRQCLHKACIRKLEEYEEKGYVGWKPYREPRIDQPHTEEFLGLHKRFLESLEEEKIRPNTIDSYRNISCKFLLYAENKGYTSLSDVPPEFVYAFFVDIQDTWSLDSIRTAAAGLKRFLRFAEDKSRLIKVVPGNLSRKRSIIPVLTTEEEQSVWNVLEQGEVSSKNKAIMVLLLLTGLRSVDIINLKLTEIDWQRDIINISQTKTSQPLILPLLPAIGNAIAKYIINDRPESELLHIFLSCSAPYRPLKSHTSCYVIVQKIFKLAEIRLGQEIKGTRLLRHHVASKMLKSGVPIQTISMTLGHADPDSTNIYLTTDEIKLRECSLPLFIIPMKVAGLL